MPGQAYVTLSPEVLDIDIVWAALAWTHNLGKRTNESEEQLKARLLQSGQVAILVDGYDPDHHFGPVITVEGRNGNRQSLEIVIPWNQVLAVIRDKTGEFKPGFMPESS